MPARRASLHERVCQRGWAAETVAQNIRRGASTNPIFARVLLTALYGPLPPQMLYICQIPHHTTRNVQQWYFVPCSALSAA